MNTVDKEKKLNDYIREWIDARYCDWSTFYHDVQINKISGIYLLKEGGELFDYLSNIVANIEEHLIAGKSCHIIPSKFSSIDQFLSFVKFQAIESYEEFIKRTISSRRTKNS